MADVTAIITGSNNFSGGETTVERVGFNSTSLLERCNGFSVEDGALRPDSLVDTLSETPLGTTPEQVPFAFVDDTETRILARDSSTVFHVSDSNVWSLTTAYAGIIPESTLTRYKKQVIVPSKTDLMIIEPDSTTTQKRPLSIKGPAEYTSAARPTLTPSAIDALTLFEATDAVDSWTAVGDGTSVSTSGDKAEFTLSSTASADAVVFTKSLGATGVSLTNKAFLVLDVKIDDDVQDNAVYGRFVNDLTLYPSGYEIVLYSDTACTTEIGRYLLPQILPVGKVNRVAINIGSRTDDVFGVGIRTSAFWTAPTGSDAYKITLYSEDFAEDWSHKGNLLLPAVRNQQSPFYAALAQVAEQQPGESLPASANLIVNPSFETDATWTLGDGASRKYNGWEGFSAKSGGWYVEMDNYGGGPEYIEQGSLAVEGGRDYAVEMWYYSDNGGDFKIVVTPNSGTAQTYGYYSTTQARFWQSKRVIWTAPEGATSATIRIEMKTGVSCDNFGVDDISFAALNQAADGSVTILQRFTEAGTDRIPENPLVKYSYCFAGRDRLADDDYSIMVSNPSDESATVFCDPWRSYDVTMVSPSGRLVTVAVQETDRGTGYAVDDILTLSTNGVGGTVKVTSIGDDDSVTGITLVSAGYGYSTGASETTGGSGTGCELMISAVDSSGPIFDYGDYLTHMLLYRQIYDGETTLWSDWSFVSSVAIAQSAVITDDGTDDEAEIDSVAVPEVMEINNAPASTARYVMTQGDRVYSACLDWSATDSKWLRPTAIQISSYQKPWAHPTLVIPSTLATDGTELDGYAVDGAIVRGLAVFDEDVLVLLDREFFRLHGDNPIDGWRFIGRQLTGCKSNRTIATGKNFVMWHDGNHFVLYAGGPATPVSRFGVDSSLIDWTKAHSAVVHDDEYIFHCYYNSGWALICYDTRLQSWRIRRSAANQVVGICTDGLIVYGVTPTGGLVDMFGGADDDGASSVLRQVWTRYCRVGPAGYDVQVNQIVIDLVAGTSGTLVVSGETIGAKNGTIAAKNLTTSTTRTRHTVGVNAKAEFVKIKLEYTGTTCPVIHYIGVDTDGAPAR